MAKAFLRYLSDHWHGRQRLLVAFGLNFVLLDLLLYQLAVIVQQTFADQTQILYYLTAGEFVVFWFIVYPWQAVGVLKTCERTLATTNHIVWARTAQAAVVLGIVTVFINGLDLIQGWYRLSHDDNNANVEARDYTLSLRADGSVIHLQGFLDYGVTRDVSELLAEHPGVKLIVLDSMGGPVYEGRGLAKLIKQRGLVTFSSTGCSSACVIAFVGGSQRVLGANAQLGFHQYKLDTRNILPHIDVNAEQDKDLAFFASQSIRTEFLEKVFRTPHSDIWFPSHRELLEAGVIQDIVDSSAIDALMR